MYAYRRDVLMRLASLPPTPLEEREKLEQLRALENGIAIGVAQWHDAEPLIEVDTPEDLELARRAWAAGVAGPACGGAR
jgi:3-deoxy-manno-octulosonate cytidylyltransferase (CMP-KDO synthetase)